MPRRRRYFGVPAQRTRADAPGTGPRSARPGCLRILRHRGYGNPDGVRIPKNRLRSGWIMD